jgi:DNA-directed RNA polymerase specialized sigma24 family protein
MMSEPNNSIFTNQAAFDAALKAIKVYIKSRFNTLSSDTIDDISITALSDAYRYQTLTIPALAFAKLVARRRATDETRREAIRQKFLLCVNFDAFYCQNTEGSLDDDETALVAESIACVKQLSAAKKSLFQADFFNNDMTEMSDDEKAEALGGLKAIRKMRFDTKAVIVKKLRENPAYMTVAYRYCQRA